jgi:putative salt-induced outer membrane protein
MTQNRLLAGAAIVALGFAGATAAQAQVAVGDRPPLTAVQTGIGIGIDEDIEDIEARTAAELRRAEDRARFGTAAVPQGFAGSLALTGLSNWGNSDNVSVGAAGRFTLGQGAINHSFGVAVDYAEVDDERETNRILGIYDLTYDFTPQFYAFGLLRGQYDEFAAANDIDLFAGAGPGIRVINTDDVAWRVQAGPGVRYTRDVETGDTETELAGIASSRLFFRVTPDVFVTNDTDLLYSDVNTLVSNELALNTRLAGPLSARVGLRTDYNTDPALDPDTGLTRRSTDNALTVGVVYSFN